MLSKPTQLFWIKSGHCRHNYLPLLRLLLIPTTTELVTVDVVATVAVTVVAVVLVALITMSLTTAHMNAHANHHILVYCVQERQRVIRTMRYCTMNWAVTLDVVLPKPDMM